jgi:hypothetical protein
VLEGGARAAAGAGVDAAHAGLKLGGELGALLEVVGPNLGFGRILALYYRSSTPYRIL